MTATTFMLAWVRCSRTCWRASIRPNVEVHVHSDGMVVFNVERRVEHADVRSQCWPVTVARRSYTFVAVVSIMRPRKVANLTALRTSVETLLVGLGWRGGSCE